MLARRLRPRTVLPSIDAAANAADNVDNSTTTSRPSSSSSHSGSNRHHHQQQQQPVLSRGTTTTASSLSCSCCGFSCRRFLTTVVGCILMLFTFQLLNGLVYPNAGGGDGAAASSLALLALSPSSNGTVVAESSSGDRIVREEEILESATKQGERQSQEAVPAAKNDQAIEEERKQDEAQQPPPEKERRRARPEPDDSNCPFRDSPIRRKVFVYPTYGMVDDGWEGSILSEYGRNLTSLAKWPWIDIEEKARANNDSHYNPKGQHVQYSTELLVREIFLNPKSCLRTYDPDEATLFYVPYMPSVEHHLGSTRAPPDYATSPYGDAIMNILDKGDYSAWERLYGLTSEYWKRRNGSDHVLVFSEPLHGLYHPRSRRGNFHYVRTQKQLKPPIVISIELSTTFIKMYPKCASKNILMPYPNTDGHWFNGRGEEETRRMLAEANLNATTSKAMLRAEKKLAKTSGGGRVLAQFYGAGNHGECVSLRRAMKREYTECSASYRTVKEKRLSNHYIHGMRMSTFCPCPHGDSPSAKRMFDSLLAGCIPIILSHDFAWPFTKEFDPKSYPDVNPDDFSIRLASNLYNNKDNKQRLFGDEPSCKQQRHDEHSEKPTGGLEAIMASISSKEIERLRAGVKKMASAYAWYELDDHSLVDNPLREGVLPTGGLAHALIKALADRASGVRWPACEEELALKLQQTPNKFRGEPTRFVC